MNHETNSPNPKKTDSNPVPDDIDVTRDLNEVKSDFVSQPSDAIFGAPAAGPPKQVGDVLQIGPYAIIGSPAPTSSGATKKKYIDGGEGRVYLAQRLDDGSNVVLKTPLPQHASDPVRCARLIREAEQLQSMNHPGIVKILDINAESEPPYYTMQHLSGGALSDSMKPGKPMTKEQVLKLGIPLADAVRYVNEELGISHRDIKPSNVMLDENGLPVFIDFGLSRDNTGDEKTLTDHRTPNTHRFKVGTARYMAPELFDGKAGNAQTDIYAFGIMLYELATGARPYQATDYPTIEKIKRLVDPDMPTQAYPQIDPGLASVIEHAVARRAKDRYVTMEDLLEDLSLIENGNPPIHAASIASDSDSGTSLQEPDIEKSVKKSPLKAVLVTAILLTAVGGGIGYAVSQGTDRTEETGQSKVSIPIPGPGHANDLQEVDSQDAIASAVQRIQSELRHPDAAQRDAAIVKKLLELIEAMPLEPTPAMRTSFDAWLHRSAALGMPQTLATLIHNADKFGASSGAKDDNGYTWLQTAVASTENAAFAKGFAKWFMANKIDRSILTQAKLGTRKPSDMADFLGRQDWAVALQLVNSN